MFLFEHCCCSHVHLVPGCVLFSLSLFPSNHAAGPKDTPVELVLEKTYNEEAGDVLPGVLIPRPWLC
jgi:hypothetical protein